MTDPPPPELDELTRELASIQDALLELPPDAFAERYDLQKRQDALRDQAAAFHQDWEAQRPTIELRAELSALRAQLASIEAQRINLVYQAGSGGQDGPSAEGLGGTGLNEGILDAQGADHIHARIGLIKGILTDRGIDPGEE